MANRYTTLQEYREQMIPIKEGFSHIDSNVGIKKTSTISDYIPMIFYINLDHRTDRKEALEKELIELGLPFERFPAIKHEFGAVGCSMSHVAVLKLAKERKYPRVLILEDDFTFVVNKDNVERIISQVRNEGKPYDVCMISYNILQSEELPETYWRKMTNGQTTSGYIIQEHYYDTLLKVIEPSIPLLEQTRQQGSYAIDVVMKQLQPSDKWYYISERIGVQRPSYSDIEYRDVNYNV
jgi:glycosyl transferase family 25